MGFNLGFKGLMTLSVAPAVQCRTVCWLGFV